jgi:2-polyprenyl-6-methoxyphenol hydroxylase-like FAD-dependent oxidoreductase
MDIAIAGAGVAGLAAAILLRRRGHHVVVYDKLAEPSPVGSGLIIQPTGQAVLQALGLNEKLHACGARIDRLYGRAHPGGCTVLDVSYAPLGEGVHGVAIHRAALFEMLLSSAVASGAEFERGKEVITAEPGAGSKTSLQFREGARSPKFDLVIDALGVFSPLIARDNQFLTYGALWANLPWQPGDVFALGALEQRYELASRMAGVLPIGTLQDGGAPLTAFFWSLRECDFVAWKAAGLNAWKSDVLQLWPETEPFVGAITDSEQLVFARYAHHTLPNPIEKGVVHIGDSWHAASPQLGQGANMALLDAYALDQAIEDTADLDSASRRFRAMRQSHVRLYQAISWLFTPVYQSDSKILPWLRDIVAAPALRIPPAPYLLASMVAGVLGNPLRKIGL